jgi:hypothetical protein
MAGNIVYGDDIIVNVAKKLNVPEHVVRHVYHFLFPYIKQKAREEGVLTIPLKGLGNLYLSTYRLERVLKQREKHKQVSKRQRDHHRRMKRNIQRFNKMYDEISNGKFVFTVHRRGSSLRKWFYNGKKSFEELEMFQNYGK